MNILWPVPAVFPILKETDVHVWASPLDLDSLEYEKFWELLSGEEKDRANRFAFDHLRHRFVAAHGKLRQLIAKYLQVLPQRIVFQKNSHGKLYLGGSPLHFNLSHSKNLALYAFTLNRAIGVDVEFIRQKIEAEEIAQRFFSEAEVRSLLSFAPERRTQAFFKCWTRKEAFIKALGLGIFYPLEQFEVDLVADFGSISLKVHDQLQAAVDWQLWALKPESQFAAAVVTMGKVNLIQEFSAANVF